MGIRTKLEQEKTMWLWTRIFLVAMLFNSAAALAGTAVTVYKSPTCGCCEKYVDYLRKNGFAVKAIDQNDMSAIKKRYGVTRVASCHTALVNGYVVEGHVPVSAINKLLKEKPAIAGISVPGMPMNSPGMGEMKKGTLTVYRIPKAGETPTVFSVE
ncbi:MAG TPA: DUF411 domain-containing protein [Novimethylophilus sp.]|jgi:hypothetical protein|uniref:DUF411 domain-containing protein n=1 Tax=Novimethylophilus sp. TaxID=2137426 RepID=UPI002F4097D4